MTIPLIRQAFSRYYIVDIVSKLICKGFLPDNEEGQSFYKLRITGWRGALCICFCL